MVLSKTQGWVYIAIPKTASTTMSMGLQRACHGQSLALYHGMDVPADFKDSTIFTIVRDPYNRLYSWWHFRCVARPCDGLHGLSMPDFLERVEAWAKGEASPGGDVSELFYPQHYIAERAGVNLTLRYEALDHDIPEMLIKPGVVRGPLISWFAKCDFRGGRDKSVHGRSAMTSDEKRVIWDLYKSDFLKYGYAK